MLNGPAARPRRKIDGEAEMFTGGAADWVADIKALAELGVASVDVRLTAATRTTRSATCAASATTCWRRSVRRRAADATRHHDAHQRRHPAAQHGRGAGGRTPGLRVGVVGRGLGTDAVSLVAWVLARATKIKAGTAIMQMQARTPSCTAMTAMTLHALSGGRFLLGVGPSGPQVIEG